MVGWLNWLKINGWMVERLMIEWTIWHDAVEDRFPYREKHSPPYVGGRGSAKTVIPSLAWPWNFQVFELSVMASRPEVRKLMPSLIKHCRYFKTERQPVMASLCPLVIKADQFDG
jgi:hypothetical protein